VDWISLVQSRDKWWAVVSRVMNIWVVLNVWEFLTSWATVSFSRRTVSHVGSYGLSNVFLSVSVTSCQMTGPLLGKELEIM
jgi:hypothetical protein